MLQHADNLVCVKGAPYLGLVVEWYMAGDCESKVKIMVMVAVIMIMIMMMMVLVCGGIVRGWRLLSPLDTMPPDKVPQAPPRRRPLLNASPTPYHSVTLSPFPQNPRIFSAVRADLFIKTLSCKLIPPVCYIFEVC